MNVEINKVKKAISGNKQAFVEIIEEIKIDLLKIAKTRLNEEDAYDAIQETIISSYKSINKLSNPKKFKSWIITILINKCNDIYLDKKYVYSIEDINDEKIDMNYTDFSKLEIEEVLNVLSEEEKMIITLYYLEGFTSKEISKILNMNENTVKTKVLRAKNKLKNRFGGAYNE